MSKKWLVPALALALSLSIWAWPSLAADTSLCSWGGYSTLHAAFAVLGYPPGAWDGLGEKALAVRHAALRGVLALGQCPEAAERLLAADPKTTERWIGDLPEILRPYLSASVTPGVVSELAQQIKCSEQTPLLCGARQRLLALSEGVPQTRGPTDLCTALGPLMMREAVEDFNKSGGDAVAGVSDLAFLLSSCPGSFFAYMHDHPAELSHWLREVQNSLFWGDPKDEASLNSYRADLIDFVERSSTGQAAEKRQIIERLKTAHVRITE